MNPLYAPVAARAAHRCEYCRAPEVIFNFRFEVEHIIPLFPRLERSLESRLGVSGMQYLQSRLSHRFRRG